MQPSSSFEIDSHVKGYHAYLDDWKPCRGEVLRAIPEPNNAVDKYALCILKDGEVVGHLKRGKRGRFAKNNLLFSSEEVGHVPDCIMGQILNFAHLT